METATDNQTPSTTLHTVAQFSERHPFISQGGLRFQIFNSKENDLEKSGALVRLGKRVRINESKYFNWIDTQQNVSGKKEVINND
jgi:hypothetical protein